MYLQIVKIYLNIVFTDLPHCRYFLIRNRIKLKSTVGNRNPSTINIFCLSDCLLESKNVQTAAGIKPSFLVGKVFSCLNGKMLPKYFCDLKKMRGYSDS